MAGFFIAQTAIANTVFSRFTEKGNHLAVVRNGNIYTYTHGPINKPQITLKREFNQLNGHNNGRDWLVTFQNS